MTPEILVMFTMEGEKPGWFWVDLLVLGTVFARRGRNAAETKNCDDTLVSNVAAQAAGSDFSRCSEIASAD